MEFKGVSSWRAHDRIIKMRGAALDQLYTLFISLQRARNAAPQSTLYICICELDTLIYTTSTRGMWNGWGSSDGGYDVRPSRGGLGRVWVCSVIIEQSDYIYIYVWDAALADCGQGDDGLWYMRLTVRAQLENHQKSADYPTSECTQYIASNRPYNWII